MLVEPRVDRAALLAAVRDLYGIEVDEAEFVPVGWAAAGYVLRGGGERYFLKLWPGGRDAAAAITRLPLVQRLHYLGFRARVPYPLVSKGSEPSASVPAGVVALFPFLPGTTPPGWPRWPAEVLEELGRTLAELHSVDPGGVLPFRERFAVTVADELRYHLADKVVRPFRADLLDQLDRLHELQRSARRLARRFVVCHTDLLGDNVLVDTEGRLSVLDWDGSLLAPPELDLAMLLIGEQPIDTVALRRVLAVYPDVPLQRDLFAFFLLRRYAEDFTARVIRLHQGGLTPDEITDATDGLRTWGSSQWTHLDETLEQIRDALTRRTG